MKPTNDERREVAAKMRKGVNEGRPFCGFVISDIIGVSYFEEVKCWNRLIDLIEPAPPSSDRGLTRLREEMLNMADEMESDVDGGTYFAIFARTIVRSYVSRIREACEGGSDAPAAGDKAEAATDAHADEGEASEGARTPNIEVLRWVKDNGGIEAVKKRLIPEGMEWPTVDGKPVDFVTGYEPSLGVLEAVSIYSNGACEVMGHDGIIKGVTDIHIAKPKVLDADGAECHVGDHGYWLDQSGVEIIIKHIDPRETSQLTVYDVHGRGNTIGAEEFTHRAPVIAADGRPLREGETVWTVKNGDGPYHVQEIRDGVSVCVEETSCEFMTKELTHERPETWERLDDDATIPSAIYCERMGIVDDGGYSPEELMARDLVRRAKALAGVE